MIQLEKSFKNDDQLLSSFLWHFPPFFSLQKSSASSDSMIAMGNMLSKIFDVTVNEAIQARNFEYLDWKSW